jgi:hypothetical protein
MRFGDTVVSVMQERAREMRPLRILQPSLTGDIAADVADLSDNPDTPITERMAWIG